MPQPDEQRPDPKDASFSAKLLRLYRPDGSYIEFKNLRIYRSPKPTAPPPPQRGFSRLIAAVIPAWPNPVYRRWLLTRVALPLLGFFALLGLILYIEICS